jgi:AcrR family transcriptional regulator
MIRRTTMPKRSHAYMVAKKREILAAAKRVALRKGFVLTSLRDIAGEVGMSMGSIANYFAKKQALVVFAAAEARASRAEILKSLANTPNPTQRFLDWVTEMLKRPNAPEEAVLELELLVEAHRSEDVGTVVKGNMNDTIQGLVTNVVVPSLEPARARDRATMLVALYLGLGALSLIGIRPSEHTVAEAFSSLTTTAGAQ